MKRTGIFGGSFNPIHCGHTALAQQILNLGLVDEVWLMVSPQNPLKQQHDLKPDDERLALARRAVAGLDGIEACDYEFHLPRPSYTWHTLQALRSDYADRDFSLIIGGDNWACIEQWHRWQDILRHHKIIVYPRDGHPGTISARLLPISSTDVRRRVQCGESIAGLVPDSIAADVVRLYSR